MACHFYFAGHYGLTTNAVNEFQQKHSFVDVRLICKNKKTVFSHKLMLASASPFLKTVIEENNSYDDMVTLYLPDFDCNIVTLLLTFLYEGVMKLKLEELKEFRELCNGLCMNFPGAEVVKLTTPERDWLTSDIQCADTTPSADTGCRADLAIREEEPPFSVPSRNDFPSAEKHRDGTTYDSVNSVMPQADVCEQRSFASDTVSSEPQPASAHPYSDEVSATHFRRILPKPATELSRTSYIKSVSLMPTSGKKINSNKNPLLKPVVDKSQNHRTSYLKPVSVTSSLPKEMNSHNSHIPSDPMAVSQLIVKQSKDVTGNYKKGISAKQQHVSVSLSNHSKFSEKKNSTGHQMKQSQPLKKSTKTNDSHTNTHDKRKLIQKPVSAKKRKKVANS